MTLNALIEKLVVLRSQHGGDLKVSIPLDLMNGDNEARVQEVVFVEAFDYVLLK